MADGPHHSPDLLIDGPTNAAVTILLAHGAGAGMDTEFMTTFARGLARQRHRVVRFEFPYMRGRRASGSRRPPDRQPVLLATWLEMIETWADTTLVIGGKSMGGRMASMVADDAGVAGLICLGYPFHPSGKPDRLRVAHLQALQTPTLILQGERDALGNQQTVSRLTLASQIQFEWLPDGDHSFKPRKSSGHTLQANWERAIEAIDAFARALA